MAKKGRTRKGSRKSRRRRRRLAFSAVDVLVKPSGAITGPGTLRGQTGDKLIWNIDNQTDDTLVLAVKDMVLKRKDPPHKPKFDLDDVIDWTDTRNKNKITIPVGEIRSLTGTLNLNPEGPILLKYSIQILQPKQALHDPDLEVAPPGNRKHRK